MVHLWICDAPLSSQSRGKHGSISVKSGQQRRFPELRNLLLMSMEPFYTRRAPHTASNETKPTNLKSNENCSNFKNLNTRVNILTYFANSKNFDFALLGLDSASKKRFWLRINKNNENIRYLRVLNWSLELKFQLIAASNPVYLESWLMTANRINWECDAPVTLGAAAAESESRLSASWEAVICSPCPAWAPPQPLSDNTNQVICRTIYFCSLDCSKTFLRAPELADVLFSSFTI